jgi:hypothetical protein
VVVGSTVPLWALLAPSVVALGAIAAAEVREYRRQKHEKAMKAVELEGQRMSKLREERLKAYSTFARLTKSVDAANPSPAPPLVEAHSEIEMLAENPELRKAADGLLQTWVSAWQSARNALNAGAENPYNAPGFKNHRKSLDAQRSAFIQLAKEELGQKPKNG